MDRELNYLRIPPAYGSWLGGLRWAPAGDAVEYLDGGTFVFSPQVALFLSGFGSRRFPHFAHVLHMLTLLGLGERTLLSTWFELARQFRALGQPLRNAGALFAHLCRDIPPPAERLDHNNYLSALLWSGSLAEMAAKAATQQIDIKSPMAGIFYAAPRPESPPFVLAGSQVTSSTIVCWVEAMGIFNEIQAECSGVIREICVKNQQVVEYDTVLFRVQAFSSETDGEEPSLGSGALESCLERALAELSNEDLEHWLKHGCGSVSEAAEQLAEELPPRRPRTLGQIVDDLTQRERLTGAVPFVAQMVSALTLPPRRLDQTELPLGGYADVTTRGRPEQILPSQFALDDLEFVRRFAQNELLYFRREEPTSQIREELLVLLDQGVRTWGTVRLVLSAAVLALVKLADRRRRPLFLAGTSTDGAVLDVRDADADELGSLMDASDLSLSPGATLERVLEEPAEALRDVVLLTHPCALGEEVIAAARRLLPGMRLFALTVDDRGRTELSEIRHGTPVSLSRFQVALDIPSPPAPHPATAAEPLTPWTGDVEIYPFPFRFGVTAKITHFTFDHGGEILLTASGNGMLHAWNLGDGTLEVLPRGRIKPEPITEVSHVLGVTGGFVVVGIVEGNPVPLHYDFERRTCTALTMDLKETSWRWHYLASHHSVVARQIQRCVGIDLASHAIFTEGGEATEENGRARRACAAVHETTLARPYLSVTHAKLPALAGGSRVYFDMDKGEITVQGVRPTWYPFTPQADGKAALVGGRMLEAQYAAGVLAVKVFTPDGKISLRLYRYGSPLNEWESSATQAFLLSCDGAHLARQTGQSQVQVHSVGHAPAPIFVTMKGRCNPDLVVEAGPSMLFVQAGGWLHLLRWDRGPLEMVHSQRDRESFLAKHLGAVQPRFHSKPESWPKKDPTRFRYVLAIPCQTRLIAVDAFGEIAVSVPGPMPLAMFFIFRNQAATWLPDGTRFGPAAIVGGPSTEGALEKIGKALRGSDGPLKRIAGAVRAVSTQRQGGTS